MMKSKIFLTIALTGFLTVCFGQQTPAWDKWNWLIGTWVGEGSGQPGEGNGSFSFSLNLDRNIIERKSHTEFPPANGKPASLHEDLLIVYHGAEGAADKAIYFDNEGHVINYAISYSEKSIVLTSEKVQGMPFFRLVYTLLEGGKVNTRFEMSRDGVNFTSYIEGKSKKSPDATL